MTTKIIPKILGLIVIVVSYIYEIRECRNCFTQLPAEDLYCDSTDVINSITVNVTDHVNGSYQYINNQPKILHTDEGNYNFTFQVGHHQSRGPLNITISVNNSVGSSPFSNHMIVREINNGNVIINQQLVIIMHI